MNINILKHYLANSNPIPGKPDEVGQQNGLTDPPDVKSPIQPTVKRRKKVPVSSSLTVKATSRQVTRPSIRFSDLGGVDSMLKTLRELIERPLLFPGLYQRLGVDPPRGILLCGPTGSGKTSLANAIAGEYGLSYFRVTATELVSGMTGESEQHIRNLFDEARMSAPSLIFIDDIDVIASRRDSSQRDMDKRISAQLMACLDSLSEPQLTGDMIEGCRAPFVLVLGATSRPEMLEPSLRRAGRFEREIKLPVPNEMGRLQILELILRSNSSRAPTEILDLPWVARHSPGFVGADLRLLVTEAAMLAIDRVWTSLSANSPQINNEPSVCPHQDSKMVIDIPTPADHPELHVKTEDFRNALSRIQPSAKREGFAVVPDASWSDIGALDNVRQALRLAVVEPLSHPALFSALGIASPAGLLLWGPPGCGKTLLAKAVARESHSNFISVKGPELLSKWVGESERAVRALFDRARSSAPCVIFFDELDALCPRRSDDASSNYAARIVNQLLTEMDGLDSRKDVYIIGATNRPDMIDPAILRPGRLDKMLYVQLPSAEERIDILQRQTRKTPLHASVDLAAIAVDPRCEGFSGADMAALVREAALKAAQQILRGHVIPENADNTILQDIPVGKVSVESCHFEEAFATVFPSVSLEDRKYYDGMHRDFTSKRVG